MKPEISLGLKVDLTITELDIRGPIFLHYHQVERSAEHQEAESHGLPLVTKRCHDEGQYWVTLSFPDLPDIFCLDERHGRFKGVALEKTLRHFGDETHVRIGWGDEHFITATWEGIQVLEFEKSYQRLKEILGEKLPKDPQWKAYGPTPQSLEEIARALK